MLGYTTGIRLNGEWSHCLGYETQRTNIDTHMPLHHL